MKPPMRSVATALNECRCRAEGWIAAAGRLGSGSTCQARLQTPRCGAESIKLADLGLDLTAKAALKREFLERMGQDGAWSELTALIESHCTQKSSVGRLRFALASTLRILIQQQSLALSDPAMEEAPVDVSLAREIARLSAVKAFVKA